ncbi:MAG: acyl-CoA thioesterase [Candidatus Heimdallarchaeota archaeon]|nr:acyl-CoA thioesterase [Candidatus Heimdallarchaeota archaeon]
MSTIDLPEKYAETSFVPRFRDSDSMGHVNNSIFSVYIETSRFEWMKSLKEQGVTDWMSFILARVEIDFVAPILLSDKISVVMWVGKIGNKSWDFNYRIINQARTKLFAKIRSVQVGYDYDQNSSKVLSSSVVEQLNLLHNNN